MTEQSTIDPQIIPENQAIAVRQGQPIGRPLSLEELHERLEFVRNVMRQEMKSGQDYGRIPGCGDKPTLLQPGAQKLLMTFNLCENVKKEEVRELRGDHREYAFTICVRSPNGKEWDGVGTCSTLEAKYRYRQCGRRCPNCGQATIFKSKQGGGFFCWAKKGGCGANFRSDDKRILGQNDARQEHDNPADFWNTVRKMAFKRGLVAATINATNTSELWTQDIEDFGSPDPTDVDGESPTATTPSKVSSEETGLPKSSTPPKTTAQPKSAPGPRYRPPTAQTRAWMVDEIAKEGLTDIAREYFQKVEGRELLMPNEGLLCLPLRHVPYSKAEMAMLITRIKQFANGDPAERAFPPHEDADDFAPAKPAAASLPKGQPTNPEWWRDVIVPLPRRGQKRADYVGNEDTLGSLYDARHGNDEESQYLRQRLFGLVEHHSEARPWIGKDGKERPPSKVDIEFAKAVCAFKSWWDENHRGEKL